MGRELKRVPMDFDWPLNKTWEGYINPFWKEGARQCPFCGGSGLNQETKKLSDAWYGFNNRNRDDAWQYHLEQEEVDALLEGGRLSDLTRYPINEEQIVRYKELQEHKNDSDEARAAYFAFDNGHTPTPEEVNEWAKKGFGHDGMNQWICVKVRAEKLGVYGECEYCQGEGELWRDGEIKQKYEEWKDYEPPAGEGYQLWKTTSEGSPASPVFETLEALCEWAEVNATTFASCKATKEQWMEMLDEGFVSHREGNIIFI